MHPSDSILKELELPGRCRQGCILGVSHTVLLKMCLSFEKQVRLILLGCLCFDNNNINQYGETLQCRAKVSMSGSLLG